MLKNVKPSKPSLSKICEKVAFFHLSKIGFFYRFQRGFRPGDSTVMQLVSIVLVNFINYS